MLLYENNPRQGGVIWPDLKQRAVTTLKWINIIYQHGPKGVIPLISM